MAKFHINLSKFKKIKSDKDTTVLEHPEGHHIVVAHNALSPKARGQLAELPLKEAPELAKPATNTVKMADGGPTPQPTQSPADRSWTHQDKKDFEKGASSGDVSVGQALNNAKKVLGFADGGPTVYGEQQQDDGPASEGSPIAGVGDVMGVVSKLGPLALALGKGGKVPHFADGGPTVYGEEDGPGSEGSPIAGVGDVMGVVSKLGPMAALLAKGGNVNFKTQKLPSYTKNIPHFADGGPTSSNIQDSPEQIVADMPQQQQADSQGGVDPHTQALQSAYNNQVSADMAPMQAGVPSYMGSQTMEDTVKNSQFGPNGEPPANFQVGSWTKAKDAYENNQKSEMLAKQQAAQKQAADNEVRVQAGLSPIPLTDDQLASMNPPAQAGGEPPKTQVPQPDAPMPGDKELARLQTSNQAVRQAMPGRQVAAENPQEVAQKLQMAKQMSYDAFMQERQKIAESMKDVKPETLGTIFADKSVPGKMGMLAGMMLSGGASALLGQPNQVISMYEKMIDNDLKSQQLNLGKKESLLSNNLAMIGHLPTAIQMTKVNMMDYQLHKLVQLASKYPNNPNVQAQLQAAGRMGAQSTSNLMDSIATNTAWMHSVQNIKDPTMKIQFNPMLTPEQKNSALKEYGEFQNADALRNETLQAFDKYAEINTVGNRIAHPIDSTQQLSKLRDITLDKLTKDTSGRVTPETVHLVGSVFKNMMEGKATTAIGRQQLAKILSQNMHFPYLQLAGVDAQSPQVGGIQAGPPKLGR